MSEMERRIVEWLARLLVLLLIACLAGVGGQ